MFRHTWFGPGCGTHTTCVHAPHPTQSHHTHTYAYRCIHPSTHVWKHVPPTMQQLLLVLGCSMFLSAVPYSVAVSPALDCLLYVSCFHREHSLSRGGLSTSSIFLRETLGEEISSFSTRSMSVLWCLGDNFTCYLRAKWHERYDTVIMYDNLDFDYKSSAFNSRD